MEDTVPLGYVAEIIDFDNIGAGDDFPSDEAREYCMRHDLYELRDHCGDEFTVQGRARREVQSRFSDCSRA